VFYTFKTLDKRTVSHINIKIFNTFWKGSFFYPLTGSLHYTAVQMSVGTATTIFLSQKSEQFAKERITWETQYITTTRDTITATKKQQVL